MASGNRNCSVNGNGYVMGVSARLGRVRQARALDWEAAA
jgi:hypothetical protein